jgi:histidine kinase
MKLAWKLFASYLVVLVVGALVLDISVSYTAPVAFERHTQEMRGMMRGNMMQGDGMQQLVDDLDENFRDAVNAALLRSTLAAAIAAILVSLFVSQRITQPIRQLVSASQRIAAGEYNTHIELNSRDELGDLTRNFNSMAAKLADTESMRQQLIADVSHELKTPLASITGYMVGLQDGVIPADAETFQKVQREADRLQRLVHDLQELSRAEAGSLAMSIQPVDAVQLAKDAVEWIRPQYDDKGVELSLQVPAVSVSVRGDYDRIRQVLLNLLGNALQYTPPGGKVALILERDQDFAHFQIRDTGIGITPENLEHIFQRFYRVDKSRSRASGGSGIGLTVASHIVRALNGEIWAESAGINQGSTFHYTLPLS